MIAIEVKGAGLEEAMAKLDDALERNVRAAFEMTLESIVVRAKQTNTFVDRTGALRNSIQSDGVTGTFDGEGLVGTISYAATSKPSRGRRRRRKGGGAGSSGAFYGVFLEYGTKHIKARRFIRDAIDAETGDLIEDAIALSFRQVGLAAG